MPKNEITSKKISSLAGRILQQNNTTVASRSLAGSALSQARSGAETTPEMANLASKVLKQTTASDEARSLAGTVLTQTPDKK